MRLQQILNKMKKQEQKIYAIGKAIVKLEKAKATLDLIPAQHGYQNALEVKKVMRLAKAELKKVQLAQKAWDAPEPKPEKMYLRIPANIPNVEKQEMQKNIGQKRSIHERLEGKKQIVEQQPKKKKQRNGMEL